MRSQYPLQPKTLQKDDLWLRDDKAIHKLLSTWNPCNDWEVKHITSYF